MTFGLESASSFAPDVDEVFKILLTVSSGIVAIVWVGIIYLCIRYRKGSSANRQHPPQKSTLLEVTVISLILIFGMVTFFISARVFYKMQHSPNNTIEVDVIAKQWMWLFHDAHSGDQINVLKIPVGRPVRLVMTSKDVIHSFFVPEFRVKQDVLPGRYTSLWFQAEKPGRYEVLCSQYCGLNHSQMRGVIEAISQEEYDKVQENPIAHSELEHGKNLFTVKGCVACHDGATPLGPSLKNLYNHDVPLADGSVVIADENYLRRSILQPHAEIVRGYSSTMPSFQGQLSEEDLMALIRYIKSEGSGI
jgi:cytochrome c oxidase subunit 2